MSEESRRLYKAVKRWDWAAIDEFVEDGGDINASLVSEGSEAGYRALHFAVIKGKDKYIKKLIEDYDADVNVVAEDGATPLHIAYLREYYDTADMLTDYLATDLDAKFSKQVYEKYNDSDNTAWTDDFGGTMTLIAFAVFNGHSEMAESLMESNPDIRIKDTHNKTLLMHAIANDDWPSVGDLAGAMQDNLELLNAKDNNGWHAVNYLLTKNKMREDLYSSSHFRYEKDEFEKAQSYFANELIKVKADINAMVNGDPDTLLLNKAALRRSSVVLSKVLRLDCPLNAEARPLNCLAVPVDPKKYSSLFYCFDNLEEDTQRRNECIKCILDYYRLRREFGLFVPKEEIKLMDEMVATNPDYKKMVADFEKEFINEYLKKSQICYGDKSITCYDVAVKVFDARSLKLLVKDDEFVEVLQTLYYENEDMLDKVDKYKLYGVISGEIHKACHRKELMEDIQNILELKIFIPLPYELILDILDYLDNEDLLQFSEAFYESIYDDILDYLDNEDSF